MSFVCFFSVHLIFTKLKKNLFISDLINKIKYKKFIKYKYFIVFFLIIKFHKINI